MILLQKNKSKNNNNRYLELQPQANTSAPGQKTIGKNHFQTSYAGEMQAHLAKNLLSTYLNGNSPSASLDVLDVGCANGELTLWLYEQLSKNLCPAVSMTGIDMSPGLIAQAKERFAENEPNLSFEVCKAQDIHHLNKNQFDLITSFSTLHWIPADQQVAVLKKMRQALKPTGTLLLLVPLRHPVLYDSIDAIQQQWQAKDPHYFNGFVETRKFFTEEQYQGFLTAAEFPIIENSMSIYDPPYYQYANVAALKQFIRSWLPQHKHLQQFQASQPNRQGGNCDCFSCLPFSFFNEPEERLAEQFLDQVVKEMIRDPRLEYTSEDGPVTLPLNYLQVNAPKAAIQNTSSYFVASPESVIFGGLEPNNK